MKHHIDYNKRECHGVYVSIIYPKGTRKETKAYHDGINERTRLKRLTVIQNTCSKSKVVHRLQCLKSVL